MKTWVERAELVVDLAPPFLGIAAVAVVTPDALGTLAVVGWLVAVLDAYLGRLFVLGATTSQRLHRLIGPAIVAAEQLWSGDAWVGWAIDSAMTGMIARSIALCAFFVLELRRRGASRDDLGMVLPGLTFIVAGWVGCIWIFGGAWLALEPDRVDGLGLGAALVSAVTADLRRMPSMGERGEAEGSERLIIAVLGAWFVACLAGGVWAAG